jgi:hypothetical protein
MVATVLVILGRGLPTPHRPVGNASLDERDLTSRDTASAVARTVPDVYSRLMRSGSHATHTMRIDGVGRSTIVRIARVASGRLRYWMTCVLCRRRLRG